MREGDRAVYIDEEFYNFFCSKCYTTQVKDPFRLLTLCIDYHIIVHNSVEVPRCCKICRRQLLFLRIGEACEKCIKIFVAVGEELLS